MSIEPLAKDRFGRAFTVGAYIITLGTPALLFAWFIWPTPWCSWVQTIDKVNKRGHHAYFYVHHRVNRFTGERQAGYAGMLGLVRWGPEHMSKSESLINITK